MQVNCRIAPLENKAIMNSPIKHDKVQISHDIRGGVRLRSRLSPGGGRNQKCHFTAKTDTFFINSFICRAYYVKSYKKLDQKAQNLDITSFTMGLRPK